MIEECEQIKRTQSSLKSSRNGSWRILKDKSAFARKTKWKHTVGKRTTNTKHGIYKATEGNKKWVRHREKAFKGLQVKKEENNS